MDCDYKIISIDSSICIFPNGNICDFYLNLDEPLRNVYKINIITILLNINNDTSSLNNNLESIYIDLNNYRRLIAKNSVEFDGKRNNLYYFDSLIIEKADRTGTGTSTIKNDYNTSDSIYYLNPIEPQLIRFNIRLLNKEGTVINLNNINKFIMKIGVYYNNKKTTRL